MLLNYFSVAIVSVVIAASAAAGNMACGIRPVIETQSIASTASAVHGVSAAVMNHVSAWLAARFER